MARFDKNKTLTLSDAIKVTQPKAFMVMTKPIGSVCNLNCTYCYYLEKEKLYSDTGSFKMTDEILEEFIRQYIASQEVPTVSFTWQGGEPTLMGLDFFIRAVELQKKYQGSKKIENAFQTNGTRLTDEWCRFFKKNDFLVGISVDGPAEMHDKYRKSKQGNPTHQEVISGIRLLKRFQVKFNTLSVINDVNVLKPLEVYRFLKKAGSGYMQFIPVVERRAGRIPDDGLTLVKPSYSDTAELTNWSVRARQFGKFMITLFDEWVRNDVGKVYVQL
ncbi:MAG: radical SAM protein, partial [Bacteroidales bacterium]|nr:radical SAM protein [Bacteroidales bacterium]